MRKVFVLESCFTLTLLEGSSNWINNCLIPISKLDLSAQTEEAESYGKERKEKEGENERHGKTHEEGGSTRDIVLEIDTDLVVLIEHMTGERDK